MTRLLILTNCTAKKKPNPARAEDLYLGAQHLKVMEGVGAARAAGDVVDVWIYSAMYGPISGETEIEPYDRTFATMRACDRRACQGWMGYRVRDLLRREGRYDVAIVALGVDYAARVELHRCRLAQPTVRLLASPEPTSRELDIPVTAGLRETKRFHAGMVALKGELVRRILVSGVHRDLGKFRGLATDLSPLES